MNVVYGDEYFIKNGPSIYIADIKSNIKGYEIFQEMIAKKLFLSGFDGNVYLNGKSLARNEEKTEIDYFQMNTIKDKSDIIVYWIGSHLSEDDLSTLIDDILLHQDKAVIGCWPFSNAYSVLKELNEDIPCDLNEMIIAINKKYLSQRESKKISV